MKELNIKIRVDEETGKIGTAWKTNGYSRDNISDLLELIGVVENFKGILTDKIKTFGTKAL